MYLVKRCRSRQISRCGCAVTLIDGHIEPVVGIMSDHPFSDETVYDDDVFAYFDDAGKTTHYVTSSKVPGPHFAFVSLN